MSEVKQYRVEVVASDGRSGDTRLVRARTPENAVKSARRMFPAELRDGTYTVKEENDDGSTHAGGPGRYPGPLAPAV
ncbi:hypothetical protein SEA_DELAGARZA_26 [Microbacterium phage DelaGarza]|nr:hypothetical protein SEA_DELAGARZA_26 [Microbacterium phage DelaGarza]